MKSSDNHCLLLLLDSVSALGLFPPSCKWRPVYCLRYNWVHPVFLYCPKALLCGQPVQFIGYVYTVFLKVNVRQNPDNGSKYHCLVWWHLVNVCLFVPQKRQLSCLCGAMTGLFKRQNIAWDYMYTWYVQRVRASETWMSHFLSSGFTMRNQWTLYFIQSFVRFIVRLDILKEDPWRSVLLVPGEWFDIWKKCQQEGNWALFGYLSLCVLWNL